MSIHALAAVRELPWIEAWAGAGDEFGGIKMLANGLQLGLRALAGDARRQAAHDLQPGPAARIALISHEQFCHGHGYLHAAAALQRAAFETRLADAHDLEQLRVEEYRPREDSRVSAEAFPPEAVTDHADRMAAFRTVIVICEKTPDRGTHAEHAEITSANQFALNALGLVGGGQVHRHAAVRHGAGERSHLPRQFAVHRVAEGIDVPPQLVAVVGYYHQTVRFRNG
jgi:hypothetical protein